MDPVKRINSPLAGALYMSAAAITMAMVGVSVKWATEGLPSLVVVFFRNFFSLAILIPWLFTPGGISPRTTRLPLHLLRCVLGLGAMYSYFYALSGLHLANAVTLNFTSPLFIPLIAWLWLGEKVNRRTAVAVAAGFTGVATIMRPGSEVFSIHALFAVISAIFASASLVSVRKLTSTEPAGRVVFYFALGSSILTVIPLFWVWQTPNPRQWIPLILTGALASVAQFLLSRGYARAPAAVAAVFQYLTVPTAALLGWIFWGERVDLFTALGAIIICVAGIAASLPARKG